MKARAAAHALEWLSMRRFGAIDIAVVGAPIARASISPSKAHTTPAAFREALTRFSTWDGDHGVSIEEIRARDLGDVAGDCEDEDAAAAHERIETAVRDAFGDAGVVAVIGGDNSLTRPAMLGAAHGDLAGGWGLITLDAHHDMRPGGPSNGSPIRELIDAGLPGSRVVQIGLHGFANARQSATWARSRRVHVIRAGQVRAHGAAGAVADALAILEGERVSRIYVDVDLDVLDRAYAPGCPASMPGGLTPAELQDAAHLLGMHDGVVAVDFCEVDAAADVAGTTVRSMASVFLSFCSGLARRKRLRSGIPT